MRLAFVAVLLFVQDPSPVPALLKRIDGKDMAASFRAIADLADLGPERREEVEKGAASLPAFYRDALLEEMKIHKSSAPRVTLDGEPRTAEAHIEMIASQAGLHFTWDQRRRDEKPNPAFPAALKDVPAFEALAGLFVGRRLECTLSRGPRQVWLSPEQSPIFGMGHRSALVVNRYAIWSRRMDFGGPPEWRLNLSFYGLTAHGSKMIGWKWPRLVEAVAEEGVTLTQESGPDNSAVLWSDEPHYSTAPSLMRGFWMDLKAPQRVKELERLKFVAVAVCTEENGTIEIKTKAGGGTGEASAYGLAASIVEVGQEGQGRIRVRIRVKPAALSPMDLLNRPVTAEAFVSGFDGGQTWTSEEIVDGAVEYSVQWTPARIVEGNSASVLKRVRLTLPVKTVDRPVYAEFRNLPTSNE